LVQEQLSIVGLVLPYFMSKFGFDGWRYAWFLLGTIVFVLSFVCHFFLRDSPGEKGTSIYGGKEERKNRSDFTFFSAWRDVVREKEIWKLGAVYCMFGFSYIIYLTFFIAYLTSEAGLTPKKAGEMFAVMGLVSISSGVMWGWISDVVGRRYGFVLAYLALACSYFVLAFWRNSAAFYVSSIIFGIALSSMPAIMAAAVGDYMGGKLAPAALGFVTVIFGIGQSLGPAIAGWMKDATGTFAGCFIFSALVSLLGAAGSLILKSKATHT
jgi:predicted MFS family arabinose efflux permease